MANTRSAKKMVRKIARRTAVNKARRSRMRTFVKKVELAIAGGDAAQARAALREAESELMRAVTKGVIHKNTGSRKVSRLSARVKAMTAA
jgi:small subunit ribosomal protein S20